MNRQDQPVGTTGPEPVDAAGELARLRAVCRRQSEVIDGLGRRCARLREDTLALRSANARLHAELYRTLGEGSCPGPSQAARRAPPAGQIGLPAGSRAPGAARSHVGHHLRGQAPRRVITDAQLVVSELVTNSLEHAGMIRDDLLGLTIELGHGVVRLEVEDPGSRGEIVPRGPDLVTGGGFGLNVVVAVAARWGVIRDRTTRVWAELTWPADVALVR